jgi:hypothetical protein
MGGGAPVKLRVGAFRAEGLASRYALVTEDGLKLQTADQLL